MSQEPHQYPGLPPGQACFEPHREPPKRPNGAAAPAQCFVTLQPCDKLGCWDRADGKRFCERLDQARHDVHGASFSVDNLNPKPVYRVKAGSRAVV